MPDLNTRHLTQLTHGIFCFGAVIVTFVYLPSSLGRYSPFSTCPMLGAFGFHHQNRDFLLMYIVHFFSFQSSNIVKLFLPHRAGLDSSTSSKRERTSNN